MLLQLWRSYLVFLQFTLSLFHVSFPSRIKKRSKKIGLLLKYGCLHSSVGRTLQQFCWGFWRMKMKMKMKRKMKCASVKCRRNIYSCINTTFLDLHQPLPAVIDFIIRLRILVTMFRISLLFPFWNSHFIFSKIFIVTIDVKPLLSRTITQQIRINFSEEHLNVFSLPTKSCVPPIKTW